MPAAKPILMPKAAAKPVAAMPAANPASVVSVAPHIRNQSKSPHDIIKHFRDLVGPYGGYAAEMTDRASIVTEPKLVNIAVALTALEEMLQQLSQKTTK
jgi:hypothetical protein